MWLAAVIQAASVQAAAAGGMVPPVSTSTRTSMCTASCRRRVVTPQFSPSTGPETCELGVVSVARSQVPVGVVPEHYPHQDVHRVHPCECCPGKTSPPYGMPLRRSGRTRVVQQRDTGAGDDGTEDLHPRSKATRRGPMDEMRQLVRERGSWQQRCPHVNARCLDES